MNGPEKLQSILASLQAGLEEKVGKSIRLKDHVHVEALHDVIRQLNIFSNLLSSKDEGGKDCAIDIFDSIIEEWLSLKDAQKKPVFTQDMLEHCLSEYDKDKNKYIEVWKKCQKIGAGVIKKGDGTPHSSKIFRDAGSGAEAYYSDSDSDSDSDQKTIDVTTHSSPTSHALPEESSDVAILRAATKCGFLAPLFFVWCIV